MANFLTNLPWLKDRSQDFRRGLANASFNSAGAVFVPLVWLIAMPYFLHKLGGERFGIWMLINTVLGLSQVMAFGLTDAVIKHVAKYRAQDKSENVSRVIQTCLSVYIGLGLLAGGLMFLLAPILSRNVFNIEQEDLAVATGAFRIASAGIALRLFQELFASLLRGFERYDIDVALHTATTICTILLNAALLYFGFGLKAVVWCPCALMLAQGFAQVALIKFRVFPKLRLMPALHIPELRETFAYGIFVFTQTVFGRINETLDHFLIAGFVNTTAVGYYSVCRKLMRSVYTVIGRASSFLFAFSAKWYENKEWDRLYVWYVKSSLLVAVAALAIILPVGYLSEPILRLWMGKAFAGKAHIILSILCIRYVAMPIGIITNQYFRGTGMVRFQTLMTIMSAPLITVGIVLLVPRYGATGAAWAMLFSLPFLLVQRVYLSRKLFRMRSIIYELLYFLPAILSCASLILLSRVMDRDISSWAQLAFHFACFAGLALLVGVGVSLVIGSMLLGVRRKRAEVLT